MIQVEIFSGKTVQDFKTTMNAWFQNLGDKGADVHVLSMLPLPTQQGMFLLMIYEAT